MRFFYITRFNISGRKTRGFTLIEIMVAITIMAILATVGMTTYNQSQLRARDAKRKQDLRAVATALELFYQTYKRFPCSGNGWVNSSLGSWITDLQDATYCAAGTGTTLAPRFISQVPKDPLSNTGSGYQANTFGYGYNSNPTNPYGTCSGTGYYILAAQLENPNDSESIRNNSSLTVCGKSNTVLQNEGWGPNTFVLSTH